VLTLAGAVLTLVGGVALYLGHDVVNEDAFADHAVQSLDDGGVRQAVAREVASQVAGPFAVQPRIETGVNRALGTPAFHEALHTAAIRTNKLAFDDRSGEIVLELDRPLEIVRPELDRIAPGLADRLPASAGIRLLDLQETSQAADVLRTLDDLDDWGPILLILGLLSLAGSVALAPDRIVAAGRVGLALVVGAAVVVAGVITLEEVAASNAHGGGVLSGADVSLVVRGIWEAYLGDLVLWAIAVGGVGLVVVAGSMVARRIV
jgi:hypothetical protein